MALRLAGGEAMMESSLSEPSAILSVLGIGVAVIVNISLCPRSCLRASFCLTPKRCSSSIIINPKFLYLIEPWISLWVPITISILPS